MVTKVEPGKEKEMAKPGEERGPGRRLHGAIAHRLGTDILSGKYAPGDVLSGEVAYAEELQVSRSAYREAIQVLTAKGLVASRPKAGTDRKSTRLNPSHSCAYRMTCLAW